MAFNSMAMISFVYLLLLVLLITLTASSSSLLSHDEECLALFQFKQTILHQNYTTTFSGGFQKLDSWRRPTISNMSDHGSSDCCLWDGVVCSINESNVIELDLSQSSIRGPIKSNSTLFKLVHLQKLNLSMNDFAESQIPSEIARLKQLTSLDLYNSGFSGEIPNEISHLVKLSILDLSWNPLLKLQTPASLLQNLTRLEKLYLEQVNISSSIPHFLANFSSLTLIYFGECQLQGKFPAAILNLPKLKYINLRLNPDLTGFLPRFRNNTLLEHLNLYKTGFSGIIPESIGNLNHLVFFVLADSFFSGNIPPTLSNLTQLNFLGLRKNNFTGTIPLLISLSKLKILELSYNNFEKGRDYNWIGKLTSLEELYLDGMNIHQEILPSLANLTKLSVVSMAENYIFGRIPSSFMNLTQLTIVTLHHNQLHGPIPSAFSNFKSLKVIDLKGNNFNGKVDLDKFLSLNTLEGLYLEKISLVTTENYTYGTLPQLSELGLSSCELKEFPAFLRFQMKMIALYLTNNKIGGLIPSWILNNNKKTMIFIDLSYNKLIGEIPPLICQVESLGFLDLSSNSLTGTLPTCLGNLRSLVYLNLKRNKFHGAILDTFTRESPLKMIDFSENRFTGPLPKSIANCSNLEVLSIRDNSFDGVFPFWLGTLIELQVLILRSNKFSGAILAPSTSSSEFPKLRILDLSNNGFSGQLPDKYFRIWTAMKSLYAGNSPTMTFELSSGSYFTYTSYSMSIINKGVKTEYQTILKIFTAIDLSCNSFEGEIPQSLASLQGLESLNLSNNHLTGYVLPSLRNLKNLESLDLSHNELSGKIPRELLQLGFLAMFNVSFNHLEGRIPTGKQFDTFDTESYVDNPLLCGQPLSNKCPGSTTSTPSQTSDEYDSFLPNDIMDWVVIFSAFGSGLVIGIIVGNFLYARYQDWFEQQFGMTKDTWLRPLGSRTRN